MLVNEMENTADRPGKAFLQSLRIVFDALFYVRHRGR
jgi:hypothetical protein